MPSESRNVAQALIDRLIEWGVTVIFGLPGDGINGIMEALRERKDKIRFVQVRHAEIRDALQAALSSNKPAIVEAVVDPFEPPMPARITKDQAVNMSKALVRGEPRRGRIALTLFRDKVRELT